MSKNSHSTYKSTGGMKRIFSAFGYSMQGLKAAWHYEAAFRQETVLALVLLPLAWLLGRTPIEIFLLSALVIAVLVVELVNSAIEAIADAISLEPNPLIGRAKDIASAAVFLSLICCGSFWLYVALSRFIE